VVDGLRAHGLPVRRAHELDVAHLLLVDPSLDDVLSLLRDRLDRRGSLWVLTPDHADGAAIRALVRAVGVEGRPLARAAASSEPPTGEQTWAWLTSLPAWGQGPTGGAHRLEPVDDGLSTHHDEVRIHGDGPLASALGGGGGIDAHVVEAPDRALRSLGPSHLALGDLAPLLASEAPVLLPADALTQRPGSAPNAFRGAWLAWHLSRQSERAWARVGPVGPGPRTLGIAGLAPATVRRTLLGCTGDVLLDVDWSSALMAFPHMRPLAGHLVDHPLIRRGKATRAVLEEARRLLQGPVPRDQPLAELGVDSLMAEELRQRLALRFGHTLPPTFLLDHGTAAGVGAALAELSSRKAP